MINADGHYEYPILYKNNANGSLMAWHIKIRLIKTASRTVHKGPNWNMLVEATVPIVQAYVDRELPTGLIAQYWTEYGQVNGATTISVPTYTNPTNVGRSNYRHSLQQAISRADRAWKDKVEKEKYSTKKTSTVTSLMYSPALASTLAKKIVKYPVYVQKKYDGVRCVSHLVNGQVKMYSRRLLPFEHNPAISYICEQLRPYLVKMMREKESIYLDGEFYMHSTKLNEVMSLVKNPATPEGTLNYYIFDMFYPSYTTESFGARYSLLTDMFEIKTDERDLDGSKRDLDRSKRDLDRSKRDLDGSKPNGSKRDLDLSEPNGSRSVVDHRIEENIYLAATYLVEDEDEMKDAFETSLHAGYEGIMLRNPSGKYSKSLTPSSSLRNANIIKVKQAYEDEFKVVGYEVNKYGGVKWRCVTRDGKEEFMVAMKGYSTEELAEIAAQLADEPDLFDNAYKDRMLTVKYMSLTHTGKPSHAHGIVFRENT
jgi:ATP-dependent DNA ligase